MSFLETTTVVLAQAGPTPDTGGQGEDFGKSSPVGLLLLVLFGIAVAFLIRSMNKHLKTLPTNFDEDRAEAAAPPRAKVASASSAGSQQESPEQDGDDPGISDPENTRTDSDAEGDRSADDGSSDVRSEEEVASDVGSGEPGASGVEEKPKN